MQLPSWEKKCFCHYLVSILFLKNVMPAYKKARFDPYRILNSSLLLYLLGLSQMFQAIIHVSKLLHNTWWVNVNNFYRAQFLLLPPWLCSFHLSSSSSLANFPKKIGHQVTKGVRGMAGPETGTRLRVLQVAAGLKKSRKKEKKKTKKKQYTRMIEARRIHKPSSVHTNMWAYAPWEFLRPLSRRGLIVGPFVLSLPWRHSRVYRFLLSFVGVFVSDWGEFLCAPVLGVVRYTS